MADGPRWLRWGLWSQVAAVGSVVPDGCSGVCRVCGPGGDGETVPRDLQTAAQETPQEVWASLAGAVLQMPVMSICGQM